MSPQPPRLMSRRTAFSAPRSEAAIIAPLLAVIMRAGERKKKPKDRPEDNSRKPA